MYDLLSKIIVAAITAVITAPLTVWLSLRRFYSEKWWERKLTAYLTVIEALHHLSVPFDRAIEAAIENRELGEDEKSKLWAKHVEAEAEILKHLDMGELLMSTDSVQLLRKMLRSLDEARAKTDHTDYLTTNQRAIWECLTELKPIAMTDLNVARHAWFARGVSVFRRTHGKARK
jgi:hypothetical protein